MPDVQEDRPACRLLPSNHYECYGPTRTSPQTSSRARSSRFRLEVNQIPNITLLGLTFRRSSRASLVDIWLYFYEQLADPMLFAATAPLRALSETVFRACLESGSFGQADDVSK